MAAASAGGPKSGIDPVSGTINCIPPQQLLNQHQQTLMQHHKQQQHHPQFIHQIQQQQNHQQHQISQPLHHSQKPHQPQQYFHPKITVVPKLIDKVIRSGSSGVQQTTESVSNISASQQNQQLNYENLTIKKPPQILPTKGPNVSKGWRRLIIKGDIVYLSPSGGALTSLANVKDYLLKSGTCKCGLPCPLRPEIFFDFDVEVPNRLLRLNNVESSTCSHIDKAIAVQPVQTAGTTIVGRRKIIKEWPNSQQKVSTVISSGIIPQNVNNSNVNSNSNIISIQKQIKSQNSSSIVNVGSNVVHSNIHNNIHNNQIQSNLSSSVVVDSKLSNLKLTRSPPWRKKASFVAPQNQSSQQHMVNEIVVSNNERVPPLPTQHIPPVIIGNQASQHGGGSQPNIRIIKTGNSSGSTTATIRAKKNPSFKDDPTGYLDHQTAILQNSILSVPSPDIPVINEPRNVIQPNSSGITINNNPIQIFNSNPHQVININSNGTNFISQNQHQPHHQHTTASFPLHNNQILVQQQNNSNDQILHQTPNQIVTNIPQTTTFCGQTVTHMPNGVVQIHNQSLQSGNHSNHTNSVPSDITIQQQLQIQQQIHQQNQLIRQTQQLQQSHNYSINDEIHVNPSHNDKLLPDSQESPVSSSTTIYSQTPDTTRITPDLIMSSKGPVQGGTISTSNDSTSSSTSSSPVEQPLEINLNATNAYRLNSFASSETTSKNTITSVLAGRAMTATTTVNPSTNFNQTRQQYNQSETYDHQNIMSVTNQIPDIQIQQISRDDSSNHSTSSHHSNHGQQQQFIMTSNGQIILMSNKGQASQASGSGSNTHQMIINTNNGGSGSQQFSIDNHGLQSNVQIISQQNMIQAHKNNQFNNYNNVILSSSGNANNNNQNLSGNMLNSQQQQTVVLNTIPSGFVIPNFVDGSQVIINQGGNSGGNFVQHQIQVSPDSKRRPKKRKNSMSPQSPSPTTIQVPQQNQSMLQIATPQYSQNFQLSPSLSGITIIPNQTHHKNPQQQIIMSHQNGQIIQPINLIGQQLLVPAGLVVAPETTLLQIQNCGSILTQQGMMIRAPSPQNIQNKSFLSPNGQGQQFIVNSNGQVSPIGQIYSTPVGLVVPQTNAGQTFVQQNTTIVQQQTTMMNNNNNNNNSNGNKSLIETQSNDNSNVGHSVSTQTAHQQQQITSLPPDTTTHSPRSPERPASSKSIGGSDQMNMAMVQCVSSSEPDSAVSPFDSRQSPAIEYNDRSSTGFRNYQQTTFKSTDSKIRRIESTMIVDRKNSLDNIESSSSSPPSSQATTTITTSTTPPSPNQITFCIGELVWGSIKGHPAWPAKLINPPNGIKTTTPGSTWVRWFGRKPNIELVPIRDLKSLSEGLDAHHRAQKDIRKSRKLNAQLENAIQEAMIELDRISSSTSSSSSTTTSSSTTIPTKQKYHNRITKNRRLGGCGTASSSSSSATASSTAIGSSSNISGTVINQGRINKPIKIAPAPAPLQSCQPPSAAHQIATLNQTSLTINNLTNQIQPNPGITQQHHHHQQHTIQIKCLRSSK